MFSDLKPASGTLLTSHRDEEECMTRRYSLWRTVEPEPSNDWRALMGALLFFFVFSPFSASIGRNQDYAILELVPSNRYGLLSCLSRQK